MKAFTDRDLKYLKQECAKGKGPYWLPVGLEEDKHVTLLINRLEAAEKALQLVREDNRCYCIASPSGHSIFDAKCARCKILEAWHKACEK